jgi:uncharacterized SAM-binding protein YcdF (DUF218 family)
MDKGYLRRCCSVVTLQKTIKAVVAEWRSLPARSRRWLLIGGILLGGVDLLVLTYEPLLTWFAYRFRAEDPLVQSEAIVVLLGGPGDRPRRAAEIYQQGLAPIVLMGQTARGIGETEAHLQALLHSGVPRAAIAILSGDVVSSTHDEALEVRDYVRSHRIRRITVITSAYHSARVRWTFRKVLRGLGVDVRMAVSRDPRFTESDWYTCGEGIRLYLSETLKSVYYRLAY